MSKKLCKQGLRLNKEGKKIKFECEKCGLFTTKEKFCCDPIKLKKSA